MPDTRSFKTRIAADAQRFQELKVDLAGIGYFSKGTVLACMIKCENRNALAGADPNKRHGPYFEWTYKEQGKTVNVRLTACFRLRPNSTRKSNQPFSSLAL